MNLRYLPFFTVLFFGAAHLEADAYPYKQSINETHPFQADGTLSLHNVNGEVTVRTWDRNEIQITGERSAKTEEELALIELKIDPRPERVAIDVKLPKRKKGWFGGGEIRANVEFTITVPVGARLDAVSTVNGTVNIQGVRGRVHASTVNGAVKAVDIAGDVSLSTVNGGINAQLAALQADGEVEAECVNGGVTLKLPANASAKIDASVVNGGIDCDFPVQVNGKIGGRRLNGVIGDGATKVKARTVNGGVRIERS
ncbi:DUF4097 family beta strand repeat-containing protein [Opitutus sp. ER46]|uniref:DUF4097 family beta strand repeat-containing protein n=1 Tax=Opitutus sp. ER46 TaxID=2161864 RepID=UPI0011B24993|nr:DUF4097 family beta strand repeat-containing protein [Opitutus sp. ER46]